MMEPQRSHDPTDFYDSDLSALPLADAASRPQPTLPELWRAGVDVADGDRSNAERDRIADAYRPILEVLNEGRPRRVWRTDADDRHAYVNPGQWGPADEIGSHERDQEEALIWREIQRRRQADPKFLPEVPATLDEFHKRVGQMAMAKRAAAGDVLSRNKSIAGTVVGFAGGAAKSLDDPLTLATLPIGGGGKTIAQRILIEGLANAGVEAIQQPTLAKRRASLGDKLTLGEAVTNVAVAGAVGSVLQGAAIEPAGALLRRVRERLGNRMTPAERGAAQVIERDEEVAASSPFRPGADTEEHIARLDTARATLNGTPPVAPAPATSVDALSSDQIVRFVLNDLEGGAKVVNYSAADGGVTKYGVAAVHNPGVDVANLTEGQAADIAKRKYWFRGLDAADPRTAAIAFDAGYISGPDVGRRILRESGGDPNRALDLYRQHLDNVADTVPGKAKYRNGWRNRVDKLEQFVGSAPGSGPRLREELFADDQEWVAAQRQLQEADAAVERARAEDANAGDTIYRRPETTEVRATVSREEAAELEAGGLGPASNLSFLPQRGEPGVSVINEEGHFGTAVFRDADGVAQGVVRMPLTAEARDISGEVSSYVRPDFRRQGIATRLYDGLRDAGYAVDELSGTSELTPDGAAFVNARRNRPTAVKKRTRASAPSTPKDLYRFLAERGGIRDAEGHDLVRGRNLQTFVPGRGNLIRATGMPLDRARELAAEAGYFHHMAPDEAFGGTTVADFLDMLEEAKGSKRYALADIDEMARRDLEDAWKLDQQMRADLQAGSGLSAFDDPIAGSGPRSLVESLEHDLRMDVAADPNLTVRLSDETGEQLVSEVLDDLEADAAALSAARQCMMPPARAA